GSLAPPPLLADGRALRETGSHGPGSLLPAADIPGTATGAFQTGGLGEAAARSAGGHFVGGRVAPRPDALTRGQPAFHLLPILTYAGGGACAVRRERAVKATPGATASVADVCF